MHVSLLKNNKELMYSAKRKVWECKPVDFFYVIFPAHEKKLQRVEWKWIPGLFSDQFYASREYFKKNPKHKRGKVNHGLNCTSLLLPTPYFNRQWINLCVLFCFGVFFLTSMYLYNFVLIWYSSWSYYKLGIHPFKSYL